ncbi:MAG: hypothetical protein QNJ46_22775 [Leptolyngbyaceae cyanobacterium MO_188.B28]|nr:hypothetical protein [Leptolyngbyaceae cyanobacterium MO_188.B28]
MIGKHILKYASNCFILLIPIFLWNILFAASLPRGYAIEFFGRDIPPIIGATENILRITVFVLPLLMPLTIKNTRQKIGLGIYLVGLVIYFLSWIMQIYHPDSTWSSSLFGFLAPAYTTIIWFIGIGLIGDKIFIKIPYKPIIYIAISSVFVFVHTTHAYIVYMRL